MEASVPSDFPNNKLPLLNSQVWIENTKEGPQVRYEHYEKPMASGLEIQEKSAISDQIKRSSLVQGGITRLLNTSTELGKTKQNEILSKYMKKIIFIIWLAYVWIIEEYNHVNNLLWPSKNGIWGIKLVHLVQDT